MFQDFRLLEDRNVYDNVAFTLHVTGARGSEIKKKVLHTLGDVGLSHARNKMAHETLRRGAAARGDRPRAGQ